MASDYNKLKATERSTIDRWVVEPMMRFINNSTMGGIVLFSSALLALILANSPWSEEFHQLWEYKFTIGIGDYILSKSLHHWINDGLMAVFFFVVGLELKREIVAGELSDPKNAVMPIVAALGGMLIPALIYTLFNQGGATEGWGVPMATDIAFALGVLYLLGKSVPLSLKIFLTALAIVDDIGAVLVIAFFYTSQIDFVSLGFGAGFMVVLVGANLLGVRSSLFYGIIGIGGLWLAFLLSGVHATIAAVLAAMTIPANVKITENEYVEGVKKLLTKFKEASPNEESIVTTEQYNILQNIRSFSKKALTPLQRLENSMHPLVIFIIMPVFALSNAGITFSGDILAKINSPVFWGVFVGLLGGKLIGIYGLVGLLLHFKMIEMPEGMTKMHLLGGSFLAAIGFTMSLFIVSLAFTDSVQIEQAKMGVLFASFFASFAGYFIVKYASGKERS